MQARAEIVAELTSSGRTQLTRIAGDGPLTVRPTRTAERARVHLVAGVFGPLGGDLLTLTVRVGPGAELEVGAVAATLVLPSRDTRPSRMLIDVEVSEDARLTLTLPPTVIATGASHTVDTRVVLGRDALLVMREEAVRGRTHEAGGSVRLVTRIDGAGRPITRQDLSLEGTVGGPWRPRVVGSIFVVGPDLKAPEELTPNEMNEAVNDVRAAWLTLPGAAGYQLTALGHDPLAVSQLLDSQLPRYTV